MALLGGIGGLVVGAMGLGACFGLWGKGVRRYGRKADALAVSLILAFLAALVLLILVTPSI
jgi:hypothetical protein